MLKEVKIGEFVLEYYNVNNDLYYTMFIRKRGDYIYDTLEYPFKTQLWGYNIRRTNTVEEASKKLNNINKRDMLRSLLKFGIQGL